MTATDPTLIGRDEELRTFAAALARAQTSASSTVLLLEGPPGIGKTRLCEALSSNALESGARVAWGRCWETPGAPPYWPWRQLFDGLPVDDQALRDGLAGQSTLAPELANLDTIERTTRVLRGAAQTHRLVLVLEDLHAADTASLNLLVAVARALRTARIVWVLTARDHDARLDADRRSLLSRLAREGTRLQLRPFTAAQVSTLSAAVHGASLPETTAARVVAATEGTPLFVTELVRLLARDPSAKSLPLPSSARDVLRDRLDLLPASARPTLEVASVLGHRFDEAVLRPLAPRASEVQWALESAAQAGLVRAAGRGEWHFAHSLLHGALYDDLSPARRAALHAAALETVTQAGAPPETLAHHALQGVPMVDASRAVQLARAAAEHCARMFAFDRANALLEQALLVLGEGATQTHLDVLLQLSGAQLGLSRNSLAILSAERAAALAKTLNDTRGLALAALASGAVFRLGVVDPALVSVLRSALAGLGPSPEKTLVPLAIRLKARLAAALQPSAEPQEPLTMAREAIDEARALGDEDTLVSTLHYALSALGDLTDATEREPLVRELVEVAARRGDRLLAHRSLCRLVIALLELGDVTGADAAIGQLEQLALGLGPVWTWRPLLFRSLRAAMRGDFTESTSHCAQARAAMDELETGDARIVLDLHELWCAQLRGPDEQLGEHATRLLHRMQATGIDTSQFGDLTVAFYAARAGALDAARARLAHVPQALADSPDRTMLFWLSTAAGVTGDRRLCERLRPKLLESAERFVTGGLMASSFEGPVLWPLGLVECALGDTASGARRLTQARSRCLAIGATTIAAHIERDLARVTQHRPPAAEPIATQLQLVREGDTWRLEGAPVPVRLRDSRGVQMLARLLDAPGREFHALELSASELGPTDAGDAGEVADAAAITQYRARLASLTAELDEAERNGNIGLLERLRAEHDFLTDAVSEAVGLGGRARRVGSNAERARVNVQRRLKDALRKIEEQWPAGGRQLARAVRTGSFCCYELP